MGRESWTFSLMRWLLYVSCGACSIIDAHFSYEFLYKLAPATPFRWAVASCMSLAVATLCSTFGSFLTSPDSWAFLYDVPTRIAQIENLHQRRAKIVGHIFFSLFMFVVVISVFCLDFISTSASINTKNLWVKYPLTIAIVVSGSACLYFARISGQQAKAARRVEEIQNERLYGFSQEPTTVETSVVGEEEEEFEVPRRNRNRRAV